MSRRTIVLPIAALALGAWLALRPAPQVATVVEPPIDIETPAGRARLDAALALAWMPDDPWTFAESIPVASAASDAADSRSRCGGDQVPVFEASSPDADGVVRKLPQETKPGGVGYIGARRRIDALLRASADPFDRGVADALNVDDVLTPTGRLDALVQDAVTSSDPRIYALAFEACNRSGMQWIGGSPPAASCAQLDAHEWARRDPGNAVPWLLVLQRADKTGDQAAQREALQQMASSSRFDGHFGASAAAVARLELSDADLAVQSSLVAQAMVLDAFSPFSALTERCRDEAGGDQDRAVVCEGIGEVLFNHSDTMMTRAVGGSIHRLATGDSSRLDQARQEQRAYGEHWKPATGFSLCEDMRQGLKHVVRIGAIGSLAAMKEDLPRSMAIDAIGIAAAQVGPGAFMACKAATPADANVWQQCTAMIDLLEHRSDALQARMFGAGLDKRLTGNAKPGELAASELKQLLSLDLAASTGCEDLRAKLAFMRRVVVEGEVASTRGFTH